VSAETLARQLAAMGRDLEIQVTVLGKYEDEAVEAEGKYRLKDALYEDMLASGMLRSDQRNAETRKAEARLDCIPERDAMQQAYTDWGRAKAKVRMQQASLSALHKRIEIGRSLLSRERALLGLSGSGVDT